MFLIFWVPLKKLISDSYDSIAITLLKVSFNNQNRNICRLFKTLGFFSDPASYPACLLIIINIMSDRSPWIPKSEYAGDEFVSDPLICSIICYPVEKITGPSWFSGSETSHRTWCRHLGRGERRRTSITFRCCWWPTGSDQTHGWINRWKSWRGLLLISYTLSVKNSRLKK